MMPEWGSVVAFAGLLLGGGGLAALWRARGQNRTDDRAQLTTEQQAFRQSQAAALSRLDTLIEQLQKRNDVLEDRDIEKGRQIEHLATMNEQQAAQMAKQAVQIAELQASNVQLTTQVGELTEAKAAVIQQLQVEVGKNRFLEAENNDFRREVKRLQEKLPHRSERS